mmetsp:Transcript_635/g.775  ORF Transcript_635/g.775 Transcript_635/m.775 type:complete len:347 (-) Transcript_635:1213-2253(-)
MENETVNHIDEDQPRRRARSLSVANEEEDKIRRGIVSTQTTPSSSDENDGGEDAGTNVRTAPKVKKHVPLSQKTINIVKNLEEQKEPLSMSSDNVLTQEKLEEEALEAVEATAAKVNVAERSNNRGKRRGSATMTGDKIIAKDGHDYYVKILLLGDSGVGKTSLMLRFSDDQFQESLMSTAGVDFKVRYLEKNNTRTKCQIWDTAGQERFHVITRAYYRGSHGIALVYDAANESSFKQIEYWMENIRKHASSDVSVVLLGNKTDLPNKKITPEQGKEIAEKYNIKFFETSAKTGSNVVDAFETLSEQIVTKWQSDPKKPPTPNSEKGTVNLLADSQQKRNKCCVVS